jgi:hypothetical protein
VLVQTTDNGSYPGGDNHRNDGENEKIAGFDAEDVDDDNYDGTGEIGGKVSVMSVEPDETFDGDKFVDGRPGD